MDIVVLGQVADWAKEEERLFQLVACFLARSAASLIDLDVVRPSGTDLILTLWDEAPR